MTYPGDHDSGPLQLLRALLRTFRVGWFFGVEVRMYWAAAIVTPLVFLSMLGGGALPAGLRLLLALLFTAVLFVIVWTHEMGHIWMARRCGVPTSLITLSPLGGVAHLGHAAPTPASEIRIALAGPAVHLLWLAVSWPLQWLVGDALIADGSTIAQVGDWLLWFLVSSNQGMLLFNLLPIFPLDGGRTARGLLSLRWHPNRVTLWVATAGMIGGGAIAVSALWSPEVASTIGLLIGLMCIQACIHERRVARHALIYQGVQRHPWEGDPDAWKRGAAAGPPPRGPGLFARWRERRRAQQAERDRALDAEVDSILGRLHEVGMQGLSTREKATLKRAADRRRGAG
ncbi:MAG: site-2 protease family protein [Planctomycetota bacterium]